VTTANTRMSLVPLRAGFDLVLRGYDREQVHGYVERTEAEMRRLAAERASANARADDLGARLDMAHREIGSLRGQLNRICRSPIDLTGLNDRLRHMVRLAREEAEEITAKATSAAEELTGGLDRRRQQLEAEHRELMATTKARLDTMTAQAERERKQAAAEAERAAAEQDRAARQRADQLVREATERAGEIVGSAQRQVDALNSCRDDLAAQLQDVQGLLDKAEPLLRPVPEEEETPAR
jgi:vacuolar-type H+-ATPase subunit H